jgi:hypothetical protein
VGISFNSLLKNQHMKPKFLSIFIYLSVMLLWADTAFANAPLGCVVPYCPEGPFKGEEDEATFRRTYTKRSISQNHKISGTAQVRNGDAPSINKAEFEDHIALDKKRIFKVIPLGNNIPMDVGAFDQFGDEAQVWNMPDFDQYNVMNDLTIEHISPESSGFEDEFPEATHCFYYKHMNKYEFVQMAEEDLFTLGYIEVDENDEGEVLDIYLTVTPFPLEMGVEFEGTVIIEYTDDPDIDSIFSTQEYIVSGYGTLNTYDDGPVEAIKLNHSRMRLKYNDGVVIDSSLLQEVIWYSPEGHFLRGTLIEGAPTSGQTNIEHFKYQRLDTGVSTKEVTTKGTALNYFPNPVSAGDVLTVTHTMDTHFGLVRLYDIQGRQVQQMDLSALGAVRNFQVQLPSDLVAGLYTYQVYSPQGASIGLGKLQIQ